MNDQYGQQTLSELQSTSTGCKWIIASSHAIEYGITDFTSILQSATAAQTRSFIIILDDPLSAGILIEQGYEFGLFARNTQILGSNEITVPSLWQNMKKSTVISAMQGYIGVHYRPIRQMLQSSNIIYVLIYVLP